MSIKSHIFNFLIDLLPFSQFAITFPFSAHAKMTHMPFALGLMARSGSIGAPTTPHSHSSLLLSRAPPWSSSPLPSATTATVFLHCPCLTEAPSRSLAGLHCPCRGTGRAGFPSSIALCVDKRRCWNSLRRRKLTQGRAL